MTDLEALREALGHLQRDFGIALMMPSSLTDQARERLLIHDAARQFLRLMEGAETVWWCEEHRSEMGPALLKCRIANLLDWHHTPVEPCRMVKADLHIREEETV